MSRMSCIRLAGMPALIMQFPEHARLNTYLPLIDNVNLRRRNVSPAVYGCLLFGVTMRRVCYLLRGGHIMAVAEFMASSDQEAVARAHLLFSQDNDGVEGFEVWDGNRLVTTHPDPPSWELFKPVRPRPIRPARRRQPSAV